MTKIKRSDAIYLEIESFADYELTQCVAYEMAIRNYQNLSSINEVINYYKTNNIAQEAFYDEELGEIISSPKDELTRKLNQLILIPYIVADGGFIADTDYLIDRDDFLQNLFESFDTYKDKRINPKIYDIIFDEYLLNYCTETRGINSEDARVVTYEDAEITALEKRSFRDGYSIFTSISTPSEYAYIPINSKDQNSDTRLIESVEDFQLLIDLELHDQLSYETKITTNFKRPKLKLSYLYNVMPTKLEIDINRPINEIISLVEHIKKDFDCNKSLFKTPIELLGEQIKRADNMIYNKEGKRFNGKSILSKQQRLADMFFIYDALKDKMTQRQIQNEIFNYYADKGMDTKTMDAKTLKKYKEIAIDYIDNERYKELVTGIKMGI